MTEDQKLRREAKKAERTPEQSRAALRKLVRIFYDLQRLRLQTEGRTYDRATEIELHIADVNVLNNRAGELRRAEREALKDIQSHLKTMPAYTKILADKERFKGIGPTLAGVILAEVDITRANTVSALWRYAGLAPVHGKRCNQCNDVVSPNKGGKSFKHEFKRKKKCSAGDLLSPGAVYEAGHAERPVKGEKLHYNKFLKTKMVGVMSGCLLKANSPYRKFYDDYKHRLLHADKDIDDGHRNRKALRYMVKMVLLDIWKDWRALEGLEVRPSYQEQYLGHKHSA